jgi:hypothetical protein
MSGIGKMMQGLGVFYGVSFLTGGILGFVPGFTDHEMFLGLFIVNPLHSAMHAASGVIFLVASAIGTWAARLWFQVFGFVYAVLAGWGFWVGDGMICGLITNNAYDSWGHAGLALSMLLVGFLVARPIPATNPATHQ